MSDKFNPNPDIPVTAFVIGAGNLPTGAIEYIVLTNLIPAGFEIENPCMNDISGMDWTKDKASPIAIDLWAVLPIVFQKGTQRT